MATKQKMKWVLNNKGRIEEIPIEGEEATSVVRCFLNDIGRTGKRLKALKVIADYALEDIDAKEKAAKEAKKQAKE